MRIQYICQARYTFGDTVDKTRTLGEGALIVFTKIYWLKAPCPKNKSHRKFGFWPMAMASPKVYLIPGTNWINFSFTQNICWIPKWAPTHVFSSRYVICDAKFWQPRNMAFQSLKNIIHYLLHNISTGQLSRKAKVSQHIFASVFKFTKLIMIDEVFYVFLSAQYGMLCWAIILFVKKIILCHNFRMDFFTKILFNGANHFLLGWQTVVDRSG